MLAVTSPSDHLEPEGVEDKVRRSKFSHAGCYSCWSMLAHARSEGVQEVVLRILSIHKIAIGISGGNHSYMLGRKVYKRGHKVKKHARQTDVDKVRYFEIILRLAKNRSRLLI